MVALTIIVANILNISAQTAGGGRVGVSVSTDDSTVKRRSRPPAKRTTPKRTAQPGKTAAAYQADGDKFYDDKDYDSALVAYQNAARLKPTLRSLYRIGWIYNDFEEYAKALPMLNQAIAIDPTASAVYLEKGYALRRLKQNNEAIGALKKSIELNEQSSIANFELGSLYSDLSMFNEAVAMLRRAVSLRADYADAYEELGVALRRLGRNADAITALEKSIELDPEDSGGHMGLGDVYFYGTKEYEKAIDAYLEGLRYDPNNSVAAHNVGWVYNDQGNYSEALKWLNEATRIRPGYTSAYAETGYAYMKLKRYSEATTALNRAIGLDRDNQIAHYYLGQVYNSTNNKNAALAEYRELQRLKSDYAQKLYKLLYP